MSLPAVFRRRDMEMGFLPPGNPGSHGKGRSLFNGKMVRVAAMMMHVIDKGNTQIVAQREDVDRHKQRIIVFQGEPLSGVPGQKGGIARETLETLRLVPISTAHMNVDDFGSNRPRDDCLILSLGDGPLDHVLLRRAKHHELVRMKAQAYVVRFPERVDAPQHGKNAFRVRQHVYRIKPRPGGCTLETAARVYGTL